MTRPLAVAALLVLAGCSSSDPEAELASGEASALAAPAGAFSLYAFRTSGGGAATTVRLDLVSPDSAATTAWDLGLRGADVVLNGGTSGPGAGVGVAVDVPFGQVRDARLDAVPYRRDGESACPGGPPRAVCPGDLLAEDPATGGLRPVPGRTLVLRLGDNGGFAKVEVEDYDGDRAGGVYDVQFTVNPRGPSFVPAD